MSPIQTIAVAVRLFAIWLAIYAGRMLPQFYRETVSFDDPGMSVASVVIGILIALFINGHNDGNRDTC
jgi:hypothetical protein